MNDWHVDSNQMIRGFPYQDGNLISITVEQVIDITILKVKIRSIYDDYCVFILSGVIKLFIKNYSSGNIVGNIFLFDFSSIPREKCKIAWIIVALKMQNRMDNS